MTAMELIEKGWTQRAFARDRDGRKVLASDPRACKWCIGGAIYLAYPDQTAWLEAVAKLRKVIGDIALPTWWNDAPERTHEEVIEACRKAGI
jgi:hypothetical protein